MGIGPAQTSNHLGPAIAAALILHGAVIFGVGFEAQPPGEPVRDLDIALVRQPGSGETQYTLAEPVTDASAPDWPQPDEGIADLRARLDRLRQHHASLPDTLVLTTVSAKDSSQASYLQYWVGRIERIGNDNYPAQARRQSIFGTIRLAVTLERDGRVAAIDVLQSSGHRVLDQAALHILRLAAPFAPIPESISEDRIEIIRTWHFIPGHQFVAAAN